MSHSHYWSLGRRKCPGENYLEGRWKRTRGCLGKCPDPHAGVTSFQMWGSGFMIRATMVNTQANRQLLTSSSISSARQERKTAEKSHCKLVSLRIFFYPYYYICTMLSSLTSLEPYKLRQLYDVCGLH